MTRREFILAFGSAPVTWPLAAQAQPMPVIGFLNSQSPEGYTGPLRGFRQGLKDAGYVEGENEAIVYRNAGSTWAQSRTSWLLSSGKEGRLFSESGYPLKPRGWKLYGHS